MLEGLESINWSELQHAGGAAGDVRALIRALLSRSENVRDEAIDSLFETIWHQGTVYEASSAAVPFLQELLRSTDTPDRVRIAGLLAEMAEGRPTLEAAASSPAMEPLMRKVLAGEGRDFDQELEAGRGFARATREAVGRELALLYPYLNCEAVEVRRSVATALGNYPASADETLPLLRQAVVSEAEQDVKEAMQQAIVSLEAGV